MKEYYKVQLGDNGHDVVRVRESNGKVLNHKVVIRGLDVNDATRVVQDLNRDALDIEVMR